MARGHRSHPGTLPYVVVARGNLPGNAWYRREVSSHRTANLAMRVACEKRDAYARFTVPENQWFAWSVVDVRTNATVFEIY